MQPGESMPNFSLPPPLSLSPLLPSTLLFSHQRSFPLFFFHPLCFFNGKWIPLMLNVHSFCFLETHFGSRLSWSLRLPSLSVPLPLFLSDCFVVVVVSVFCLCFGFGGMKIAESNFMAVNNPFYKSGPHALCLASLLRSLGCQGSLSPAPLHSLSVSSLPYAPMVAVPHPFPDPTFKDHA